MSTYGNILMTKLEVVRWAQNKTRSTYTLLGNSGTYLIGFIIIRMRLISDRTRSGNEIFGFILQLLTIL